MRVAAAGVRLTERGRGWGAVEVAIGRRYNLPEDPGD
jgi:hypothetical protein